MAYDETPGQRDDAAEQKAGVPSADQRASAESEQFERQFAEKVTQGDQPDNGSAKAERAADPSPPDRTEPKPSAGAGPEKAGQPEDGSPGEKSDSEAKSEKNDPTPPAAEPHPPTEPISTNRRQGAPSAPSSGQPGGSGSSPWARPDGNPAPGAAPVTPTGDAGGQQPQPYPATLPYQGGGAGYPSYPAASAAGGTVYPGAPGAPVQGVPGQGYNLAYGQPPGQPPLQPPGQQPGVPADGEPSPTGGPSWRKLLIAGVALGLVAALIGGWLGGVVGYRYAASGGHLSVLDGPSPDADSASAPEGVIEQVAQSTLPSVVQIRVTAGPQSGAGSGMVISPDGLILTNNHVVAMAAAGGDLKVLFQDGKIAPGKIVGRDKTSDVAVVQAQNVSGLKPITLGNSDSVQVGQSVMAIGSPLGLGGTVTTGIVSALNRAVSVGSEDDDPGPPGLPKRQTPRPDGGLPQLPGPTPEPPSPDDQKSAASGDEVLNAIQTDAAINPGNSGGPLVDLEGNVVGINTAIASVAGDGGQGGSVGLGFSIPINQAKRIASELQHTGHAMTASLGAMVQTAGRLAPLAAESGAMVVSVEPGSPAAAAGLKAQDRIVKIDKRPIPGGSELVAAIRGHAPGDTVELMLSDGRTLRAVLAGKPDS